MPTLTPARGELEAARLAAHFDLLAALVPVPARPPWPRNAPPTPVLELRPYQQAAAAAGFAGSSETGYWVPLYRDRSMCPRTGPERRI